MPRLPKAKKFYEMDPVDRAVADFSVLENPQPSDLHLVRTVAQVQRGLDIYRAQAEGMTVEEMEEEKHNSKRLGRYMTQDGDPRPHKLCDAHAIVSGAHKQSAELRGILALFGLRVDDPFNGCWLPANTDAVPHMPDRLRNAVPHSRIHRKKYYGWLRDEVLNILLIKSKEQLVEALRFVEFRLQSGKYPQKIMEPARK